MASGPEALLKTLFKAMGFDPQQFAGGVQEFIGTVYGRLDEFDRRMKAQEELMRQIVALLVERQNERQNGAGGSVVQFEREPDQLRISGSDRATGTTGG